MCVSHFKVVNQWETCGLQVNKLKKIDESRASALRFCKYDKCHLYQHILRRSLNWILSSSWQAEICQRRLKCSTGGVYKSRGSQERRASFLQTCSCHSRTRETDSYLSQSLPSIDPASEPQEKAAAVRKRRPPASEPSQEALSHPHCRGHGLVERILTSVSVQCSTRARCKL